jgi:hypothetical protein
MDFSSDLKEATENGFKNDSNLQRGKYTSSSSSSIESEYDENELTRKLNER